jgi:3-oxoacyl-[acyl-carrier-protein] synthase-1
MSIIYQIADNIISPMGFTTEANIRAVIAGEIGGLSFPENTWNIPEPFFESVIDDQNIEKAGENLTGFNHLTRFEKLLILSATDAIDKAGIDASSPETLFILSTTKVNIDLLENRKKSGYNEQQVHLWQSANILSSYFKNPNTPLVVSNACISGVSAQIVAQRLLKGGKYKHAIVVGADLVSRFIISGSNRLSVIATSV